MQKRSITLWITRGIKNSSKHKHKLYVKFLKKKQIGKMDLNIKKPGMLLNKQEEKRDVITKKFVQKKSY